jgi:flagellar biosynthetic protein FlhB
MSERTEAPTPRRRQEAREQGQVARSQEINAAVGLLIGVWLLGGPGVQLAIQLQAITLNAIERLPRAQADGDWLRGELVGDLNLLLPSLLPIVFGLMLSGIVVTLIQTRMFWANKRITPDLNRLNPLNGFKRLLSMQGLVEMLKALLKLVIVGLLAFNFLRNEQAALIGLVQTDLSNAIGSFVRLASALATRIAIVYFLMAILDYAYQRHQLEKSLKMTKDEVKEDFKRMEGDPFIRGRIRQQQRRMARARMMSQVPQADVIITNPTHLALALRYQADQMGAPVLLAKGADRIAEKIISIAREHGIAVVQDKPLARAMYPLVEIGEQVPAEMYMAVAEVLAYVYDLKARKHRSLAPAGQAKRTSLITPQG